MSKTWEESHTGLLSIKKSHGVILRLFGIPFLLFGGYLFVMFVYGAYQAVSMGGMAQLLERSLALFFTLVVGLLFVFPGIYLVLFREKAIIDRRQEKVTHILDFVIWQRRKEYGTDSFTQIELKYEHKRLTDWRHTNYARIGGKSSTDIFSLCLIPINGDPLVIAADNFMEPMLELGHLVSNYTGLKLVDHSEVDAAQVEQAESPAEFDDEIEAKKESRVRVDANEQFERKSLPDGGMAYIFPPLASRSPGLIMKTALPAVVLFVLAGYLAVVLGDFWPFAILPGLVACLFLIGAIGTWLAIVIMVQASGVIITKRLAGISWSKDLSFSDIKDVRAVKDTSSKQKFWGLEFRLNGGSAVDPGVSFDVKSVANRVAKELWELVASKR